MKLNKIISTTLITLMLATTSMLSASSELTTNGSNEPMLLAYYGQVNSNGTIRTKRVNGYYQSNGTYVDSYYRS